MGIKSICIAVLFGISIVALAEGKKVAVENVKQTTEVKAEQNNSKPEQASEQVINTIVEDHIKSLDILKTIDDRIKANDDKFKVIPYQRIDILSIIISVALVFLGIMVLRYFLSDDSPSNDELNSFDKNWVIKKVNEKINEAQQNRGSLSPNSSNSKVSKLESDIEKLTKQLESLELKVKNYNAPMEVILPKYDPPSWQDNKQSELKVPAEIFFLSTPNSDGSFNESSALPSFKEGASIYRFIKTGNDRAKFQIDERESSVKLALQYPDKTIDPVCDAENAFNPKAKRIVTEVQGEAELVSEKWVVNKLQKAKIRYEL